MTNWQSYTVRNVRGNLRELCAHFRIVTAEMALKRITRGWSPEQAVCEPHRKPGRKAKSV